MGKDIYLELAKNSTQILQTIYSDIAQPGVRQVGLALETVFCLCNTILLPLKLLNERCHHIFQKNMDDYRRSMSNVKDENIASVPPEIGLPLLERLATIEESHLRSLFIKLLKTASCKETQSVAHPSFIHRLDSMTADEALILLYVANRKLVEFPYIIVRMRARTRQADVTTLTRPLTGLEKQISVNYPQNINLYIDNLLSMGIIDTDPTRELKNEGLVALIEEQYSDILDNLATTITGMNEDEDVRSTDGPEMFLDKRFYYLTNYGKAFVEACTGQRL